jgi:Protein of unknown function (DUF433)
MNVNWRERIVIDPAIHHGGEPCITGTRVPVSVIVGSIADGDTPQQIVVGVQLSEGLQRPGQSRSRAHPQGYLFLFHYIRPSVKLIVFPQPVRTFRGAA